MKKELNTKQLPDRKKEEKNATKKQSPDTNPN